MDNSNIINESTRIVEIIQFITDNSDILMQTFRFLRKMVENDEYNWKNKNDLFSNESKLMCPMDTQCGLTSSFLMNMFTEKNNAEYHKLLTPDNHAKFVKTMNDVDNFVNIKNISQPTMIDITIPYEISLNDSSFPGHNMIFVIIPANNGTSYYCVQSFINQYTPKFKKLTRDEFDTYLMAYSLVFREINDRDEIIIRKDLWEICTWVPYDNKMTEILKNLNLYVEITKVPLTSIDQVYQKLFGILGIGYGIFLSLSYFIKNLFNTSNQVCACKFLNSNKFRDEKYECRKISGDHNVDNTIFVKYKGKYPQVANGPRKEVENIFKLYEYISILYGSKNPHHFVITFNKSFFGNFLNPNSTTVLMHIEDYLKHFENSILRLLMMRIAPHYGETKRLYLCQLMNVIYDLYDKKSNNNINHNLRSLDTNTSKRVLMWIENNKVDRFRIFQVIGFTEIINNFIFPDIVYFFLKVKESKFDEYMEQLKWTNLDDCNTIFQDSIFKYDYDLGYKRYLNKMAKSYGLMRINANYILEKFFRGCDEKGKMKTNFINFLDKYLSKVNPVNYRRILLLTTISFLQTI